MLFLDIQQDHPVWQTATTFGNDGLFNPNVVPEINPDFLPLVPVDKERELLNDAFIVCQALKRYDLKHRQSLHSTDSEERQKALQHDQNIYRFVAGYFMELEEVNQKLFQSDRLQTVRTRIEQADLKQEAEESMIQFVKRRVQQFPDGIQIATDCDLTMTKRADYLQMIPASIIAEGYMAHPDHGRESFPYVFVRYWREAMNILQGNYYFIGNNVELRPGLIELLNKAKVSQTPVHIVSANFRPFIDGVIDRLPQDTITSSFAVENDTLLATDKSAVLRLLADNEPDKALFYFGDGASDEHAADALANPHVVCYFALEGGSFEKILKDRKLPHFTYKDMHDTTAILMELGVLH